jgi:hypothetical protein
MWQYEMQDVFHTMQYEYVVTQKHDFINQVTVKNDDKT